MKIVILLLTLGLTTTSQAIAAGNPYVTVHWKNSDAQGSYQTPKKDSYIRITSPRNIRGIKAHHTVFTCFDDASSQTCNFKILLEVLNKPSIAKISVTHKQRPCSAYTCPYDPNPISRLNEIMKVEFSNGLTLFSTITIK